MTNPIQRGGLFVLYHLSIVTGIVLLPIALVAKQAGVTLPVHRIVRGLERSYERHA